MATLTVQQIDRTGLDPVAAVAASASGDEFANDGKTYFEVINGSGGSVVCTFNGQRNTNLDTASTFTVSVPASGTRLIGPFPTAYFNTASARVSVDYDDVATSSPTVRAISVNDKFN